MSKIRHCIVIIFVLGFSFHGQAQNMSVNSDGSSPDPSAMLDVQDTSRGVLVPRMTQAQRDAIASPATGLLLFQTDNGPGFYYNSGTPGTPVWTLIGSAVSAGNTINDADNDTKILVEETTDEDIIRFDLMGTEFLRLDSGRIEILNQNNNIFIGENSGQNFNFANHPAEPNTALGSFSLSSNLNGSKNTAFGANTLAANIGGFENTAIGLNSQQSGAAGAHNTSLGAYSLSNHTAGIQNTAIGSSSLINLGSGSANVAIGHGAGASMNTGDNNVLIGLEAMNQSTSGFTNTMIGFRAGFNTTGNDNVFLGREAGFNELGSDKLYIENSNSATPLIYGNFASDSIIINGVLKLDSAKDGSGYTFPGLDGTLGQVLTTDGSGNLVWSNGATTTQWTSAGQLLYPSSTNNSLAVGGTAVASNFRMQITAGSGSITKGLHIENTANAGANDKIGIEIDLDQASSKRKYGIISRIVGTPNQADSLIGIYNILTPDNNATLPFAAGFRSSYIGSDGETYGIWSEGEKYNYFEGNLGIGVSAASNKIHISDSAANPMMQLNQVNTNLYSTILFSYAGTSAWQIGTTGPANADGSGVGIYNHARNNTDLFVDGDNGNVGLNTKIPDATLSLNGTLQYKISTLNIGTNDQINDLALPSDGLVIRLTGADSNADITGFVASFDGRVVELINTTTFDITLKADDLASTAINRIYTRDINDKNIKPYATAKLIYSDADGRWIVLAGDF